MTRSVPHLAALVLALAGGACTESEAGGEGAAAPSGGAGGLGGAGGTGTGGSGANGGAGGGTCDELGPLTIHPQNPRYFATGCGEPVFLTGSHTWTNFIDGGPGDPPPVFDYPGWLDFMESHGHNFMRLWMWEQAARWAYDPAATFAPMPFLRTGPGNGLDGKPRFDLASWNEDYFDRVRQRVSQARQRGIYVAIMLFDGWSVESKGHANPWFGHPFNGANNINGVDGDDNGDGEGEDSHTLVDEAVTAIQEELVRRMITAVNDLPNVLFEISNESGAHSTAWQYHMIDFIHGVEAELPHQHPVGMTFQYPGGTNAALLDSPAEWISPNAQGGYTDNPPPADGSKIVVSDTDHLWGLGGSADWVWRTFLRGHQPIFMDAYDTDFYPSEFTQWNPLRAAMGQARTYAERLDLAQALPRGDLASSHYCLAVPGSQYVVYTPGGEVTLDLSAGSGTLQVEWLTVATGEVQAGSPVQAGPAVALTPPVSGAAIAFVE